MPVYVDEFESEVTFTDDESPLSERQLDAVVTCVIAKLDEIKRDQKSIAEATQLRTEARKTAGMDR